MSFIDIRTGRLPTLRRVLVLNQYAIPRTQGGGTRHIDLFGRLTDWEPVIVATSRNHATQDVYATDDPRFRLVSLPAYRGNGVGRIMGWLLYVVKATAIGLRCRKLDLVYASSPHLFAVVAGLVVARVRRVPMVMEVRDLWPESIVAADALRRGSPVHRALLRLERRLYLSADSIVVVTSGWEGHFADLGVDPKRLSVIPNGSSIEDFMVDESRSELRRRWGIDGFTALYAGAHGPANAIDLILDAAQQSPDMNFLLVGNGPAKAAAVARAQLESLSNVEFRDAISKSELPGLLAACDVGIHAIARMDVLDKGMSPNKVFDYMAAGLPVVSNAVAGLAAVAGDDECGRFGETHELAECLAEIHRADEATRARWVANGQRIVEARFSRDTTADALRLVLDQADGGRQRGRRRHP